MFALYCLGLARDEAARADLTRLADSDPDESIRQRARWALARLR